jgi:hypothetical protein
MRISTVLEWRVTNRNIMRINGMSTKKVVMQISGMNIMRNVEVRVGMGLSIGIGYGIGCWG